MIKESGVRSTSQIRDVGIIATGTAFPEGLGRWIRNEDIHALKYGPDWGAYFANAGYDPDYPKTHGGFSRRYWVQLPGAASDEREVTSVDLMEVAVRKALDQSPLTEDDIDLLIAFSTTSPRYSSSIATLLTGRLGLTCGAFEVKAGCSSAIHAMVIAYQFIASGARNVILVGGDTLSKITDVASSYAYAAGDGAGSLILGRVGGPDRGLHAYYLGSDGSYSDRMGVPGILPPTVEAIHRGDYFFKFTTDLHLQLERLWRLVPDQLYQISSLESSSIDCLIPHQANRNLIRTTSAAAGIQNVADYLEDYANCGPASMLIAIDRSFQDGRIRPGSKVMLCAVGGGLAWGGAIVTV